MSVLIGLRQVILKQQINKIKVADCIRGCYSGLGICDGLGLQLYILEGEINAFMLKLFLNLGRQKHNSLIGLKNVPGEAGHSC